MPKAPKPINATTFEVELLDKDKVEIGDSGSLDFKPHIKLNRWDGECFIKVSLPTEKKTEPIIIEGDKIKWVDKDFEAHFYSLEPRIVIVKDKDGNDVPFTQNELGGFEFEIILKEKPETNQIVLNIETQGLKFYYQPELTPEEIAHGAVRPNNVVGSYAVYHATKRNHIVGQTNYMAGKAFHIYRPKITDAEDKWAWGELSLDEQAGTLTTIIPQDFLDNATYPVTVDPNFGREIKGLTESFWSKNYIWGSWFSCPEAGTAISISCWHKYRDASAKLKYALYKRGDLSRVGYTDEWLVPDSYDDLKTENIISGGELTAIDYWIVGWAGGNATHAYYDTIANKGMGDGHVYNGFPAAISPDWISNERWSIYCTYEVGAAVVEGNASGSGVGLATSTAKLDVLASALGNGIGLSQSSSYLEVLAAASGQGIGLATAQAILDVLASVLGSGVGTGLVWTIYAQGSGIGSGIAYGYLDVIGVGAGSGIGTALGEGTVWVCISRRVRPSRLEIIRLKPSRLEMKRLKSSRSPLCREIRRS